MVIVFGSCEKSIYFNQAKAIKNVIINKTLVGKFRILLNDNLLPLYCTGVFFANFFIIMKGLPNLATPSLNYPLLLNNNNIKILNNTNTLFLQEF